jgi:hypothetical protein
MHQRENFNPGYLVSGIYTPLVYVKIYMRFYRNFFNIYQREKYFGPNTLEKTKHS